MELLDLVDSNIYDDMISNKFELLPITKQKKILLLENYIIKLAQEKCTLDNPLLAVDEIINGALMGGSNPEKLIREFFTIKPKKFIFTYGNNYYPNIIKKKYPNFIFETKCCSLREFIIEFVKKEPTIFMDIITHGIEETISTSHVLRHNIFEQNILSVELIDKIVKDAGHLLALHLVDGELKTI